MFRRDICGKPLQQGVFTPQSFEQNESGSSYRLIHVYKAISYCTMMKKLEKLDRIETRLKNMEINMAEIKESLEYAHAEIADLKKENE
jgi:hypothetical protein